MKKLLVLFTMMLMIMGCSGQKEVKPAPEIKKQATATPAMQMSSGSKQTPKGTVGGNWIMQVSDSKKGTYTIPMTNKSFDFTVTLYVVAWKQTGENFYGKYDGRSLITFDVDYSKLSESDVTIAGKVFVDHIGDMQFEIVPFNADEYDKTRKYATNNISVAPLGNFNGMSVFTPMYSAAKWEAVQAIDNETGKILYKANEGFADNEKYPIGINLLVENKRVTFDIPTYNSVWKLDFFRGSLENKDAVDPLKTFRDILITRMEEKQEAAENANKNKPSNNTKQKTSSSGDQNKVNGSYMTDAAGHEGFDTDGDGKLDMWFDEKGKMFIDLDKDGNWEPVEQDWSQGGIDVR